MAATKVLAVLRGASPARTLVDGSFASWRPNLDALIAGTTDAATMTAANVAELQAFMDALKAVASPALRVTMTSARSRSMPPAAHAPEKRLRKRSARKVTSDDGRAVLQDATTTLRQHLTTLRTA
jgi:hypothetical protein